MNRSTLHGVLVGMLALAVAGLWTSDRAVAEEGWGTLKGRFVFEGPIPEPEILVRKGDPSVKDAKICAAHDIKSEDLIVDPETRGLKNVFVYYYRGPVIASATKRVIHPDLAHSKQKTVVLDQKGCHFVPHAFILRTDQTLVVKSQDACNHNTNATLVRNDGFNFIVAPGDREGVKVELPTYERYVLPIKCDIHPWMRAYMLVVDHPYAAITGKDGRFEIPKLPAGTHTFRVWHTYGGGKYINKALTVTIKPGEVTDLGDISVTLEQLGG